LSDISDIIVYNTMTNRKERLDPLRDGQISMYACGITVYDKCHIGHARQAMVYDVIRRYLTYKGYQVTYVRNYTDVDDKIIDRAKQLGISPLKHSCDMITESEKDMKLLGIDKPDISPIVSEHIQDIIDFIRELIKKGFAYTTSTGDVYFAVKKFNNYGKLSNRNIEQLMHGVRKDIIDDKRDPLDFALWKTSSKDDIGWESEWGRGRPGWHIECSVMSMKYLGSNFDIHGGGRDLIFPHHENEIAQSEALTGKPFANYWIHNGLVKINGQKMSKSLNNFMSIQDALVKYHADTIRFCILSYHYSSDIDLNEEDFHIAEKNLYYINSTMVSLEQFLKATTGIIDGNILNSKIVENIQKDFEEAMDDDFNTASAISNLFKIFKYLNILLDNDKVSTSDKRSTIKVICENLHKIFEVLGLFCEEPTEYISKLRSKYTLLCDINIDEVNKLIEDRTKARENKEYKKADDIRALLDSKGILLKDRKDGRIEWDIKCLV